MQPRLHLFMLYFSLFFLNVGAGALIECQNETSHSWDRILMLFTSALFDDIGSKPISMYTRESSFHIENSFENSLVQQRCEMSQVQFSQY